MTKVNSWKGFGMKQFVPKKFFKLIYKLGSFSLIIFYSFTTVQSHLYMFWAVGSITNWFHSYKSCSDVIQSFDMWSTIQFKGRNLICEPHQSFVLQIQSHCRDLHAELTLWNLLHSYPFFSVTVLWFQIVVFDMWSIYMGLD